MHLARAASLTGFTELAQEYELDVQSLLLAAGLPRDVLNSEHADQHIALSSLEKLYILSEKESQQFDLAAKLGSQQQIATLLGVLGFVMQQSNTVGEALKKLKHYFSFQLQGAYLEISAEDKWVALSLEVQEAEKLDSIRHITEFALAAGVSILKALCGNQWQPEYVEFIHDNPKQTRKLEKYYSSPIRFNRERNAIIFLLSDLNTPTTSANPVLNTLLQRNLALLEETFVDDLPSQVEQLIHQALTAGNCSADKVALFMGVHRRTLHRMLKSSGTSYTELLDKVRKNTATNMLKQTNMSITSIANMLCYSEVSAFSRASI